MVPFENGVVSLSLLNASSQPMLTAQTFYRRLKKTRGGCYDWYHQIAAMQQEMFIVW